MKRLVLSAVFAMVAAPAFAYSCPIEMKKIDAALAAGTSLSEADLDKVKKYRAKGGRLHNAGDHEASVTTLDKAKAILGID